MFLRDAHFLARLVSGSVDTECGPAYLAGLSLPFQPVAARLLAACRKSPADLGRFPRGAAMVRSDRERRSAGHRALLGRL